jgi:hypothetical protein
MVASNHVHLLLLDNGGRDVIPKTLQPKTVLEMYGVLPYNVIR